MFRTTEEELQYINKKIVMINLFASPGAILLGLGLYGLFGAQWNAFIDMACLVFTPVRKAEIGRYEKLSSL